MSATTAFSGPCGVIDARVRETLGLDPQLTIGEQEAFLIALLGPNEENGLIAHGRLVRFSYLAQYGGLMDYEEDTYSAPPKEELPTPFSFKQGAGERIESKGVDRTIDELVNYGIVEITKHAQGDSGYTREYSLTEVGVEIYSIVTDIYADPIVKTFFHVRLFYGEMPYLELIDRMSLDFQNRELRDEL